MTAPRVTRTRTEQQIAVCDSVLERLTRLDDRKLDALIEDVQLLRGSLQELLPGTDGDGSQPST